MTRTAFIGTGNIAAVHAEALGQIKGAVLATVVDPVESRAVAFARKYKAEGHYGSLTDALKEGGFAVAHVLTPPSTHYAITKTLLDAGIGVLLEKPMAETVAQCEDLQDCARSRGLPLRVSQNYLFHPAQLKVLKALEENRIGPVRHVSCRYVMPLRQLAARQFGHWMFDSPRNLLLEQVVHPLSLIDDVAGPLTVTAVMPGERRTFADGIDLVTEWQVLLAGKNGCTVQLLISLGASYADWTLDILGDDGRISADYLASTAGVTTPGGYIDFLETMRAGYATSLGRIAQDSGNAAAYLAAQTRLVGRRDPFFLSIRNSVRDFYAALDHDRHDMDGARGTRLVRLCTDIAAASGEPTQRPQPVEHTGFRADVVVLGGTGFIGSYLTRDLVGAGKKVRVVARNTGNPARVFTHENVELVQGSIADRDFLEEAIAGVPVVVNLAHGGGGDDWEAIRNAMVGGAEKVADAVIATGAEKFLHVSSIAALYCGDPDETITDKTLPDPDKGRADYARAKAAAERILLRKCRDDGLPLSLWRPGVVVGEGTSPFHSGVGFYNRERVCLGWNDGRNPLPLVLAEDVSAALMKAIVDLPADELTGRAFNLVGDVRLTARAYTALLAEKTGRPLVYRPQSIWQQQAGEVAKWVVKKAAGRKVGFPSVRDLKSRGLVASFDTSGEKKLLGWQPVSDRQTFIDRAIQVHGR
ncbi:NAD-dependent epimerase/dehydratase family protein [Aquisalinus flavus]|nr:NAD-dependent epimerase/dehydratase family protein [Aquisalinus flavus]MBD0427597.1 NAD-dependent epimerase/dehydratase family protein [Aquisalinus flavus]